MIEHVVDGDERQPAAFGNDRKLRKAVEVADTQPSTMWWEQYDTEPVVDLNNPDVVGQLKSDLIPALPKV